MKKTIFLLILLGLASLSYANELEENFLDAPTIIGEVITGSGSGIGANSLSAWQTLYKTLPDDTLAHHLQRRVHRAYASERGFSIWTFTENQFLDQLRQRTNPVAAADSDLAAWDNLYQNVPTPELRHYILQPVHEYYAARKGWTILVRTEADYIDQIKAKLQSG